MKKQILKDTLKKDKNILILFIITSIVNISVFLLYHIITEAFWYAEAIIAVLAIILLVLDYSSNLKKYNTLLNAKNAIKNGNYDLPSADTCQENLYCEIIKNITNAINNLELAFEQEKRDMNDWYTLWVHQIKTPIAVLKLNVSESDKEISNELFRIEEYADMALSYIRLGSSQNDLVIKEHSLDEIIKDVIRKYAPQFISKKTKLEYESTNKTITTDKKWFSCIFEQFISNAVKYTNGGTVKITVNDNKLTVSDTGIGILKEDLPRIFEKGYTGNNGRTNSDSSGLGLYLSSKAAKLIGVTLSVESTYGSGSDFSISFPSDN